MIEPDKACAMGCIIQTCQGLCIDGTPDTTVTAVNKNKFWPNGSPPGCSLKTPGGYSQFASYIAYNTPPGTGAVDLECCAQALAFCQYPPSQIVPGNVNYANLRTVMVRKCSSVVGSSNPPQICTWFQDPVNCGDINFTT